jgi:hypothetical protein
MPGWLSALRAEAPSDRPLAASAFFGFAGCSVLLMWPALPIAAQWALVLTLLLGSGAVAASAYWRLARPGRAWRAASAACAASCATVVILQHAEVPLWETGPLVYVGLITANIALRLADRAASGQDHLAPWLVLVILPAMQLSTALGSASPDWWLETIYVALWWGASVVALAGRGHGLCDSRDAGGVEHGA